jgi:hypothetical protein
MTPTFVQTGACLILGGALLLPFGSAGAETGRSIALVLDASGSMNSKLPDGTVRIDAAKAAVANLVSKLPGHTRLSFRVYGHRSPTREKNCQDTAVLVPFGPLSSNRQAVLAMSSGIRAQGYTPITYVLKLAAKDLAGEDAAARVVVLVSDGKETCSADPCATAKALADADAKLVVHTVGLGVDAAARYQLQCIASVARGIYVGADNAAELAAALAKTAEAAPARKAAEITAAGSGKLRIEGAPPASHDVIDAATGQEVAKINTGHPKEVELPPGIYNVRFQNGLWTGVEVKAGATTILKPGFLRIEGRDLWGNKLLDPETGEVLGKTTAGYDRVALVPTRMLVTFANIDTTLWPEPVEIKEDATTTLRPGGLKVVRPGPFSYRVIAGDGRLAGQVSSGVSRIALPPGRYTLDAGEQRMVVELREGRDTEIKLP